ncbi:MAG: hypothetical protein PHI34_06455 [Acidobacteriota bacterium]|nr:hypothetical protein [Acidobacteriota bacterium]
MKKSALILLLGSVALLAACGGKGAPAGDQAASGQPQTPAAQAAVAPAADDEGVLLAKEILGVFDEAVAEAAGLTKDKPEAADLKPKLDALYEKYAAKMAGINPRFLALRDKDIRLFGSANGYLGENRGKRVFEKDNTLKDAYLYYNLEKGEKEIVDFLSLKLPALIDIAAKI